MQSAAREQIQSYTEVSISSGYQVRSQPVIGVSEGNPKVGVYKPLARLVIAYTTTAPKMYIIASAGSRVIQCKFPISFSAQILVCAADNCMSTSHYLHKGIDRLQGRNLLCSDILTETTNRSIFIVALGQHTPSSQGRPLSDTRARNPWTKIPRDVAVGDLIKIHEYCKIQSAECLSEDTRPKPWND